jgi:hypothetical protein
MVQDAQAQMMITATQLQEQLNAANANSRVNEEKAARWKRYYDDIVSPMLVTFHASDLQSLTSIFLSLTDILLSG